MKNYDNEDYNEIKERRINKMIEENRVEYCEEHNVLTEEWDVYED